GMGKYGLALAGMDDAGEMSSWYVFNAIGMYPFSPADDNYIISVPLFDKITVNLGNTTVTIQKENNGREITGMTYGDEKLNSWFIPHSELQKGKKLVITTR
ncbi:hypothetical protein EZS27_037482, partial [termite gut metagenome]